jgi:DNA repair protein RecO (recombination protein O)
VILRTEAIVLRSLRYGESSRIATLFTRERGKMSVIARGARRSKSRFGSALLPMSYIESVIYVKPGRSLQTLSETSHLLRFPSLARDLSKISTGLRIVELLGSVVQEEERNPALFNLVLQTLQMLSVSSANTDNLGLHFELQLAAALGFAPLIRREAVEAVGEAGGFLVLDRGSVAASSEGDHCVRGSRKALRAFAVLAAAEPETVLRMKLDERTRREVDSLIEAFMRYHLEEAYSLRGKRVIGQISAGAGS